MSEELTVIRELLENYLEMSVPKELSEITKIRILIEQLVTGGGGGLPFTGELSNGNIYYIGEFNTDFNFLEASQNFDEFFGVILFDKSSKIFFSNTNVNSEFTATDDYAVGFFGDGINKIGSYFELNSDGIFFTANFQTGDNSIGFIHDNLGFFGTNPTAQQTITAAEYAAMDTGEQLLTDKLVNYGLIQIT